MKKLRTIFFAMLCVLVGGIVLSSCGEAQFKRSYVKLGTLATTIVRGEELDTSKTVLVLEYSDKTQNREITADLLEFSEFDSSTTGQKTLTVIYNEPGEDGKVKFSTQAEVTITVVATEADVNSIISLESNLLRDFNNFKKEKPDNKQEEFKDLKQPLYVGDDNPFNFRIVATGLDGANNPISNIAKVRTDIKIERKDGENFVELTDDTLEQFVVIDTENTTLDFTDDAIGKTFRVTVKAHNRAEGYEENNTSFSTELEVVDGFNVYNAKELALYDNTNSAYDEIKEAIKTELGVDELNPKSLILQDNIEITKDDVDPNFFYDAEKDAADIAAVKDRTKSTFNPDGVDITGTPKDRLGTGLYHRTIENGEEFNFIGNYFSVDLKKFPAMLLEQEKVAEGKVVITDPKNPEYITTHLCVFYTTSSEGDERTITKGTQVNWKNLSFIGNGALRTDPENSGAILLMKQHRVNFTGYNTLMQNFYIGYFFEMGQKDQPDGEFLVDSCKGYDAYQTLFYVWGAKHVKIIDSEFVRAGGPAIIADTVNADNIGQGKVAGIDYYPANIDIVKSKIESEVSGKEPWFGTYNASSIVSGFTTMDDLLFNDQGGHKDAALPASNKTIFSGHKNDGNVEVPIINLIAIIKEGGIEGLPSGKPLSGYVRIFESEEDYQAYYSKENPVKTTYGLEMDENNSPVGNLAKLATASQDKRELQEGRVLAVLQNNQNGGYINSNIAAANGNVSPQHASFVYGVAKAIGFNTAFNDAATQFSAMMPGQELPISCDAGEFAGKNLTNQVKSLLERFELIAQAVKGLEAQSSGRGVGTFNKLYQGIVDGFSKNGTLTTLNINTFSIDNWAEMSLEDQIGAMKETIEHFESDYTYATGNYLNIYLGIGMGAVAGLYDKTAA